MPITVTVTVTVTTHNPDFSVFEGDSRDSSRWDSRIPGIPRLGFGCLLLLLLLMLASSKQEQSGAKTQASVLPPRTYPGIPVQLWYYQIPT